MTRAEQIIRSALPRAKLKSLRELAERTGIANSTLCRRMKRPAEFTARELRLIAKIIRLTPDEVMGIIGGTA